MYYDLTGTVLEAYKVYKEMPKGWKVIDGALTAPLGLVWVHNCKSRFDGKHEHRQALILDARFTIEEVIKIRERRLKARAIK